VFTPTIRRLGVRVITPTSAKAAHTIRISTTSKQQRLDSHNRLLLLLLMPWKARLRHRSGCSGPACQIGPAGLYSRKCSDYFCTALFTKYRQILKKWKKIEIVNYYYYYYYYYY